jgi:hypothetical protein
MAEVFSDETSATSAAAKSWPLLLLPVVQGASRTTTISALDARAEEPKLSKEYKHFEPSDPFEPLNGKNIAISKPDSIPLPL